MFPMVEKYKNLPRSERVIVENEVERFYGSRCTIRARKTVRPNGQQLQTEWTCVPLARISY